MDEIVNKAKNSHYPKSLKPIEESDLARLSDFLPLAKIIFDDNDVLFTDDKITEFYIPSEINQLIMTLRNESKELWKNKVLMLNHQSQNRWVDVFTTKVIYKGKNAWLAYINDISERYVDISNDERWLKLKDMITRVNNSVLLGEEINKTMDIILEGTLKTFENANLGTILLLNHDHFELIAYIGYSQEIESFKLPYERSFLYIETQGKMDKIVVLNGLPHDDRFLRIKKADGEIAFFNSVICAPIFYKGKLYGMISIESFNRNAFSAIDVTKMEFIKKNIEIAINSRLTLLEKSTMALTDQLTGLYNRHYLEEQAKFVFEKANRYKEEFNLILFDVDDLKAINDHYGHLVGDQAIKIISHDLKNITRKSDIIARFGGDEFLALSFVSSVEGLTHKYCTLLEKYQQHPLKLEDNHIVLSFSFGIATFGVDGLSLEALIKVADERLYAHKRLK